MKQKQDGTNTRSPGEFNTLVLKINTSLSGATDLNKRAPCLNKIGMPRELF